MPPDTLTRAAATLAAHFTTSLLVWSFEVDRTEDGERFAALFHDLDEEGEESLLIQPMDGGWAIFPAEGDIPILAAASLADLVGLVLRAGKGTLVGFFASHRPEVGFLAS